MARTQAFVYLFPPGLALSLLLLFALLGLPVGFSGLLCVAPWLVLSPWMARAMERKTRRALAHLAAGMAGAKARAA